MKEKFSHKIRIYLLSSVGLASALVPLKAKAFADAIIWIGSLAFFGPGTGVLTGMTSEDIRATRGWAAVCAPVAARGCANYFANPNDPKKNGFLFIYENMEKVSLFLKNSERRDIHNPNFQWPAEVRELQQYATFRANKTGALNAGVQKQMDKNAYELFIREIVKCTRNAEDYLRIGLAEKCAPNAPFRAGEIEIKN